MVRFDWVCTCMSFFWCSIWKALSMLEWTVKYCKQAKLVMKADDYSFILPVKLSEFVFNKVYGQVKKPSWPEKSVIGRLPSSLNSETSVTLHFVEILFFILNLIPITPTILTIPTIPIFRFEFRMTRRLCRWWVRLYASPILGRVVQPRVLKHNKNLKESSEAERLGDYYPERECYGSIYLITADSTAPLLASAEKVCRNITDMKTPLWRFSTVRPYPVCHSDITGWAAWQQQSVLLKPGFEITLCQQWNAGGKELLSVQVSLLEMSAYPLEIRGEQTIPWLKL